MDTSPEYLALQGDVSLSTRHVVSTVWTRWLNSDPRSSSAAAPAPLSGPRDIVVVCGTFYILRDVRVALCLRPPGSNPPVDDSVDQMDPPPAYPVDPDDLNEIR